jgi:hypothetical protein
MVKAVIAFSELWNSKVQTLLALFWVQPTARALHVGGQPPLLLCCAVEMPALASSRLALLCKQYMLSATSISH